MNCVRMQWTIGRFAADTVRGELMEYCKMQGISEAECMWRR